MSHPPSLDSKSIHDKDKDLDPPLSSATSQSKDEKEDSVDDEYPHGLALVAVFSAIMLSMFLVSLDNTIVSTAIPKITDEFHNLSQVAWYGSAYFMTFGSFQSLWGKLYHYFHLKIWFLISIGIFELGSLLCGVAPNSTAFIVGRAIAGLGAAGVAAGAFTIIGFIAPPSKRPQFLGMTGAVYGISAVLGPIIGGAFSNSVSWRWCFYINLPIGGLALIVITLFFKTPEGAKPVDAPWKEKLLQLDPGILLAKIRIAPVFWVVGAALGSVSCGLFYTMGVHTSIGKENGYQILAGVGITWAFQTATAVAQIKARPEDMSQVTAIIFFCMTLGGAVLLSAADSGFNNQIIRSLAKTAPDINPAQVLGTGATSIRRVFTAEQVPLIIDAYVDGLRIVWAFAAAAFAVSAFIGLFGSWERMSVDDVKKAAGGAA